MSGTADSDESNGDVLVPSAFECPCGRSPSSCGQSYPTTSAEQPSCAGPSPGTSNESSPAIPGGPSLPDPGLDDSREDWGDLEPDTGPTDSPQEILENARALDPDHVFALVSGGHDSLTAAHYTYMQSPLDIDGFLHIDTSIGLPETREFVEQRAEDLNIPLYIADQRRKEDSYSRRIKQYGFPGATKEAHKWEYVNNKDKPLENFLQQFDGDIMLISGATRHESEARWQNVRSDGIEEKGGYTYVSPLASWTGLDVREYRNENGLPSNEVVDILEHSGDCLCGAYADRRELEWMHAAYPHMWAYIQSLEAQVIDRARNGELKKPSYDEYILWAHGKMDDGKLAHRLDDDIQSLCQTCEKAGEADMPSDEYTTLTEAALQIPESERPNSPTLFRDAFDVTQAIPDGTESPIETLRQAYEALDAVAEGLGYSDHKEMVRMKVAEQQV